MMKQREFSPVFFQENEKKRRPGRCFGRGSAGSRDGAEKKMAVKEKKKEKKYIYS